MNNQRLFLLATLLLLASASLASAQDAPSPNPAGAPPKMLLLVHQEFRFGKKANVKSWRSLFRGLASI